MTVTLLLQVSRAGACSVPPSTTTEPSTGSRPKTRSQAATTHSSGTPSRSVIATGVRTRRTRNNNNNNNDEDSSHAPGSTKHRSQQQQSVCDNSNNDNSGADVAVSSNTTTVAAATTTTCLWTSPRKHSQQCHNSNATSACTSRALRPNGFVSPSKDLRTSPNKRNRQQQQQHNATSHQPLLLSSHANTNNIVGVSRIPCSNDTSNSKLSPSRTEALVVDLTLGDNDDDVSSSSSCSLKLSHSSPLVRQLFNNNPHYCSDATSSHYVAARTSPPVTVVSTSQVSPMMLTGSSSSNKRNYVSSNIFHSDHDISNNIFDTSATTIHQQLQEVSPMPTSDAVLASLSPSHSSAPSTPSTPHKIQVLDYEEEEEDDDEILLDENSCPGTPKTATAAAAAAAPVATHIEYMSPTTATDIARLSVASPSDHKLHKKQLFPPAVSVGRASPMGGVDPSPPKKAVKGRGRPKARGKKRWVILSEALISDY